MSQPWNSLYCRCDDAEAVAQALRAALADGGWELYNPFGLMPGKAYRRAVRLFVAPALDGWVRVIGAAEAELLPPLSRLGLCLALSLDGEQAAASVYAGGQPAPPETALLPHLRPGCGPDDLRAALAGESAAPESAGAPDAGLPLDALPDDVRALAGQVNPAQASRLFARLSGQVLSKAGAGAEADAARALVSGQDAPDWHSPGGRRIQALMACLSIPDGWREPDFTALRDAYQLHERRRRTPDARLYPGDAEALARVPDALVYIPVYGGQP